MSSSAPVRSENALTPRRTVSGDPTTEQASIAVAAVAQWHRTKQRLTNLARKPKNYPIKHIFDVFEARPGGVEKYNSYNDLEVTNSSEATLEINGLRGHFTNSAMALDA